MSPYKEVNAFSTNAALQVQASVIEKTGKATVNVELAPKSSSGSGYDWVNNKISFQLSTSELPLLCAVFLGFLPDFACARPEKGFSVERQDNKLYFRATGLTKGSREKPQLVHLPVNIADAFQVCALCLAQLQVQSGLVDGSLAIQALRGAAGLYKPDSNRC